MMDDQKLAPEAPVDPVLESPSEPARRGGRTGRSAGRARARGSLTRSREVPFLPLEGDAGRR